MTVLMTGSSGLIGAALRSFLGGGGHHVRRLRRAVSASDESTSWNPTALLHESSLARTMPTDRILTCRCGMTLVGRGRSSD